MRDPDERPGHAAERFNEPFLLMRENRFAHTALSRLRAQTNALSPRLVFLYGPSGTGKSHLVRQHVREQQRRDSRLRTRIITASEFADQFATASDNKSIDRFQKRYRSSDVFVCEDVGSLQKRTESQRQFIPILDEVLLAGGSVLLTCDRLPGELLDFSSRLVSRCHGGICARIDLPAYNSRISLLRHYATTRQIPVPEEAIQLLAERLAVSPRELLAAILQLDACSQWKGRSIDVVLVRRYLDGEVRPPSISLATIARVVARHFGVTVAAIRSSRRQHGQVLPRQVAMLLSRELSDRSLRSIAGYFGRRNHATVLHACGRINELMANNAALRRHVTEIRNALSKL